MEVKSYHSSLTITQWLVRLLRIKAKFLNIIYEDLNKLASSLCCHLHPYSTCTHIPHPLCFNYITFLLSLEHARPVPNPILLHCHLCLKYFFKGICKANSNISNISAHITLSVMPSLTI